jgi:antitoxin (DNA-binding transcriptional repressor) of toxin-antitoxin stability system
MKEIWAFEAKSRFGQLLDWVEGGDHVLITRCGEIVARLLPPAGATDSHAALDAAARVHARRKGASLGGLKIKDLIAEGRK